MNRFSFVPKRTLDYITDHLSGSLNDWSEEWGIHEGTTINVQAYNAYEQSIHADAEYYEFNTNAGYIYLSSTTRLDEFFGSFIYGLDISSITNDVHFFENEVAHYLITESIADYFSKAFSAVPKLASEQNEIYKKELFRKGGGAIFVVFSYKQILAHIVLPQCVYKKIIPEREFVRANGKLNNIELSKLELNTEVGVSVSLNTTKLNIRDLMGLENGDLLVLDHMTECDLKLLVGNNLLSRCSLGKKSNQKAIRLIN